MRRWVILMFKGKIENFLLKCEKLKYIIKTKLLKQVIELSQNALK